MIGLEIKEISEIFPLSDHFLRASLSNQNIIYISFIHHIYHAQHEHSRKAEKVMKELQDTSLGGK